MVISVAIIIPIDPIGSDQAIEPFFHLKRSITTRFQILKGRFGGQNQYCNEGCTTAFATLCPVPPDASVMSTSPKDSMRSVIELLVPTFS
jgi:hypothetical protein